MRIRSTQSTRFQPINQNGEASFGTFKNEEGVTLHYRQYTPKVIDKKLPAIVYVYGGLMSGVTNKGR